MSQRARIINMSFAGPKDLGLIDPVQALQLADPRTATTTPPPPTRPIRQR